MNRLLLIFCFFIFGAVQAQVQPAKNRVLKAPKKGQLNDSLRNNRSGGSKNTTNKNIKNKEANN